MDEQATPQSESICIEMNHETITGALGDARGNLRHLRTTATPLADGSDAIVDTVIAICQHLLAQTSDVVGVGVSIPEIIRREDGMILHARDAFAELEGVALGQIVQQRINIPVQVENDVNAMAIAESHLGSGQSRESFFYIYADAILNGAFVQNGRIWHGSHSSAGQISELVVGWMGERPITLSKRASGAGIAAEYNMRSRKFRIPDLAEIIQYAEHGDQLAIRVIRDGARMLAIVLNPVINLIDPECVVVGGVLVQIGDVWWKTFEETLRQSALSALDGLEILPATIREHPALVGAALLAHDDQASS